MAELNRRNLQQASIARIFGQVRGEDFPDWSLIELRESQRMLDQAYENFQTENLNIVETMAQPNALPIHIEVAERVEENYLSARIIFSRRIEELEGIAQNERNEELRRLALNAVPVVRENANNQGNNRPNIGNDVRLERITPDIFHGEYSKWKEWKSMYEGLVHNNQHITDTQKFHYLLRAVQGSAAQIVCGWQAIGENYAEAYNSLLAVYDNEYRIIMAHLEELQNMPKLELESHDSLRSMVDGTNRVIRQLRVAGSPVEHWDQIIVHALISRMPPRTLNAWETSQDLMVMPPLDDVLKFLERRARGIVNLKINGKQKPIDGKFKEQMKAKSIQSAAIKRKESKNSNDSKKSKNSSPICHHCQGSHPLYRCGTFLKMHPAQRKARVINLNLCQNCFSPHHAAGSEKCRFGVCKNCNLNEYHNSVLCPNAKIAVNSTSVEDPKPSTSSNSNQYGSSKPNFQ